MAHVGHRAVFVFLPLEGDPICFGQNELGGEYEWGQTSQHHNAFEVVEKTETPIKDAVANVKKKFSMFSGKDKTPEAPKADDKGVYHISSTPHPDVKPDIPLPKTDSRSTRVEMSPPPKLHGDARNIWLRLFNNNELPKNHQSKTATVWVPSELVPFAEIQDISTKQDVRMLADKIKGHKAGDPIDFRAAHKEIEETVPKADVNDRGARATADFVPDMTDKEMSEQTSILASLVDRDKVPSALEIQKMEAKWPTYSDKVGIPFADLLRYTVADFMLICNGHKPSVMLILEMRRKLIEKMDVKDLVNTATAKHVEAKEILKPGETKQVGATTFKAADGKPKFSMFSKKTA